MESYGIKISKPGVSVHSAQDSELVFSSEFNTPKLAKVVTLTATGGGAIDEIEHGLGYAPMFLSFEEIAGYDDQWFYHATSYYAPSANVWVDDEKVYYLGGAGDTTFVYLFVENLND